MSKVGKRLQNSMDRIKDCGGVIMVCHTMGGGTDYQLTSGREVSKSVVTKLRDAGLLVSGADGLFGGDDQTLHLVPR